MKFVRINEVNDFINTVEACKGDVWLTSPHGDKYMLKSLFSRYLAVGKLLDEHGDELELFCQFKEDENRFLKYFHEHPGVL